MLEKFPDLEDRVIHLLDGEGIKKVTVGDVVEGNAVLDRELEVLALSRPEWTFLELISAYGLKGDLTGVLVATKKGKSVSVVKPSGVIEKLVSNASKSLNTVAKKILRREFEAREKSVRVFPTFSWGVTVNEKRKIYALRFAVVREATNGKRTAYKLPVKMVAGGGKNRVEFYVGDIARLRAVAVRDSVDDYFSSGKGYKIVISPRGYEIEPFTVVFDGLTPIRRESKKQLIRGNTIVRTVTPDEERKTPYIMFLFHREGLLGKRETLAVFEDVSERAYRRVSLALRRKNTLIGSVVSPNTATADEPEGSRVHVLFLNTNEITVKNGKFNRFIDRFGKFPVLGLNVFDCKILSGFLRVGAVAPPCVRIYGGFLKLKEDGYSKLIIPEPPFGGFVIFIRAENGVRGVFVPLGRDKNGCVRGLLAVTDGSKTRDYPTKLLVASEKLRNSLEHYNHLKGWCACESS